MLVLFFIVLEDFLDWGDVAVAPDSVTEDAIWGKEGGQCVGEEWGRAVH